MTDINETIQNCKKELGRLEALHKAVINEHRNEIALFKLKLTDGDLTPLFYTVLINKIRYVVSATPKIVQNIRPNYEADVYIDVAVSRQLKRTKEVFERSVKFSNHSQVERILMLVHDCIDHWAYGADEMAF